MAGQCGGNTGQWIEARCAMATQWFCMHPMWPRYAQCEQSFTQWWPSVPLSPCNAPQMGFQCPVFTPMGSEWPRPPSRRAFYAYTLSFYYYFRLASGLTAYARGKKLGKKPVRVANGDQCGHKNPMEGQWPKRIAIFYHSCRSVSSVSEKSYQNSEKRVILDGRRENQRLGRRIRIQNDGRSINQLPCLWF